MLISSPQQPLGNLLVLVVGLLLSVGGPTARHNSATYNAKHRAGGGEKTSEGTCAMHLRMNIAFNSLLHLILWWWCFYPRFIGFQPQGNISSRIRSCRAG